MLVPSKGASPNHYFSTGNVIVTFGDAWGGGGGVPGRNIDYKLFIERYNRGGGGGGGGQYLMSQ